MGTRQSKRPRRSDRSRAREVKPTRKAPRKTPVKQAKPRRVPAAATAAKRATTKLPNEFEAYQAARTPREVRVDEVVDLMANGNWHAGPSHQRMAQKWGVHPGTVEHIAAEANRLLRHAFRNEPEVRQEALTRCLLRFEAIGARMMANGTPAACRVALDAAESFGRYMGIEPPKNVRVSGGVDELDKLTDEELDEIGRDGAVALRRIAQQRASESKVH